MHDTHSRDALANVHRAFATCYLDQPPVSTKAIKAAILTLLRERGPMPGTQILAMLCTGPSPDDVRSAIWELWTSDEAIDVDDTYRLVLTAETTRAGK
jgi:hypothetical protein